MAFFLSFIQLKQAFLKQECPICVIQNETASRYIDHLLWEYVNDVETRKHIIASLGYCPLHTQLLQRTELEVYKDALGINIIYEHLSLVVSKRLKAWIVKQDRPPAGVSQRIIMSLGFVPSEPAPLAVQSTCRVCQIAERSAMISLSTLLEELESKTEDITIGYTHSDGLCLYHLKYALENLHENYPAATDMLATDVIYRLRRRRTELRRYNRKSNLDYQNESFVKDEQLAWKQTQAFFNGITSNQHLENSINAR